MIESPARRLARWALALFFVADAGFHLLFTGPLAAITPTWVPDPRLAVQLTGLAAFVGGIGLLAPQTRRWAGIGLALYCVCVFPANIRHAFESTTMNGVTLGWLYHGPRLLLQPVLVWWCLWASSAIDWPLRTRA